MRDLTRNWTIDPEGSITSTVPEGNWSYQPIERPMQTIWAPPPIRGMLDRTMPADGLEG